MARSNCWRPEDPALGNRLNDRFVDVVGRLW
jgi:hypothetical protein